MLLDVSIPSDILVLVIKVLCWMVGTMVSLFGLIFGIAHKGFMKRLENIDSDLKPLVTQIAIHEEQIKEIKEDHVEMSKWLNNHDQRIQTVERTITILSK